jgi:pimeloyl-ACP methyl ester carboxylesterase
LPKRCPTSQIAACSWLPDEELLIYSREFERTGFQGGLQWYRCATSPRYTAELALFSGRTIDVPSLFISGSHDWGHYQRPGALGEMQTRACSKMMGCHFVEGAGHWVQQEQPERVVSHILAFLHRTELSQPSRLAVAGS